MTYVHSTNLHVDDLGNQQQVTSMKTKALAFFKSLFTRPAKPERIPFLGLHMQQTTEKGWLVRMHSNQRLCQYSWQPPREV